MRAAAGPLPFAGLRAADFLGGSVPFCGQLLAALGADVILVESPGDERLRRNPRWLAYNLGKDSVVGEWHSDTGRSQLEELVTSMDIVLDGGDLPGGLNPREANPRLIRTCITPFGLSGPRATWKAGELVAQAGGGVLSLSGDPSFPPAMVGVPLAFHMAGVQGAVATLLSHGRRLSTGAGSTIDLSVQEVVADLLLSEQSASWISKQANGRRPELRRRFWQCKDGLVHFVVSTGPGLALRSRALISWMNEQGEGLDMVDINFERLSLDSVDPVMFEHWQDEIGDFFLRFTKAELETEAISRRLLLHPVKTVSDILAEAHLADREIFSVATLNGSPVKVLSRLFSSTAYDVRLSAEVPQLGVRRERAQPDSRNDSERASRRPVSEPHRRLPLEGVRVVELAWAFAGPIVGKILALNGADVIKIESRKRPCPGRMSGPYPRGRPSMDGSASFANHSANKRSVAIDITHADGRELVLRLSGVADVVTENFTPGVLDRLGLGYQALKAVKPDIILLSLGLHGQTGRRALQPGFGTHIQASSGLDYLSGFPEAQLGGSSEAMADLIGPWTGVASVLAALEHRRKTGQGQDIDVSQYEALLMLMQTACVEVQMTGRKPTRRGNSSSEYCPHGLYPVAAGGWMAITVLDDQQWAALHTALPVEFQQKVDKNWTIDERLGRSDELDKVLAEWTGTRSGAALAEQLQNEGVPAYVVNDTFTLFTDSQLVARQHYGFPEHPFMGSMPVDKPAFRLDDRDWEVRAAPPYGSGTAEVLSEWLQLDADSVADMVAAGVVRFE